MPIYEYRCEDCGELTEMLQRFDDPPLETCPECGGSVKKLISAPAFQFKGSGWYVTDYARSSADGDAKSAPDRDGGAAGGESGATDSTASGASASGASASGASDPGASETKRAGAPGDPPAKSPRGKAGGGSGGAGDSGTERGKTSGGRAAAGPGASGS